MTTRAATKIALAPTYNGTGVRMAAASPFAPAKIEALPLIETPLSRDLDAENSPVFDAGLDLVEQFADYGRVFADDLRTPCLQVPVVLDLCFQALATLGVVTGRVSAPPARATDAAARKRSTSRAWSRLCSARARAPPPTVLARTQRMDVKPQ